MNIDDKFSSHVKSVFDDYEDGTADQGWAELLKKHPERGTMVQKPRTVYPMRLWLGGIAASILVACMVLFFGNEVEEKAGHVAKTKESTEQKNVITEVKVPNADAKNGSTITEIGPRLAEVAEPTQQRKTTAAVAITTQQNVTVVPGIAQNNTTTNPLIADKPVAPSQSGNTQSSATQDTPGKSNAVAAFDSGNSEKKPSNLEEFLEQEARKASELASDKTKKSKAITSFDVYAGTFLNYFESNPAKLNAGFGVNANVKLSKKISLSIGAGLSENTIAYENSLPRSALESMTSSFPLNSNQSLNSQVGKGSGGGFDSPAGPAGAGPNVTFASKNSGPSTDMSINAVLLNLDVPIALKFYAGKDDRFYFLTGVNSNSYINQKYMQSYSEFNYVSNTSETKEQEIEGSKMNGFDFANSAIFAIGINQDLSKSTTLTFEPFYKPSLKGLGDKNIRLNTVGVNLKLNLGRRK